MLILPLDGNHEVVKVRICTNEQFQSEVVIKYAQNGITSEILNFGRNTARNDRELVFEPDIPVSASHIYIFTSNPKRYISEVEVFERTPSDFALCYPRCIDIDIKENYYLDTVSVFTDEKGYFHYTVYTSMDGRDFTYLGRKNNNESCNAATGDVFCADGREARIIRVYMEYNSLSAEANITNLTFTGRKSNTPVVNAPEIEVSDFNLIGECTDDM